MKTKKASMRISKTKNSLKALTTLAILTGGIVGSVPHILAASSWAPTLLVNTESFQVIDDTDSASDLYLQFGGTLNKRLTYDRALTTFIFDDDLEVVGTISGATIHAQDLLTSSGQLIVEANDTYEPASIFLDQNANGTGMLIDSESSSQAALALDIGATGRDASGDATNTHLLFGYNNVFDTNLFRQKADTLYTDDSLWVGETASGARVHAQDRLSTSGSLVVENSFFGAGLTDCDDGTNSKLLWDATTGQFSCGTDQSGGGGGGSFSGTGSLQNFFDNRYVNTSGDTMTGALIFNPSIDSTTMFQIFDADGGNPVFSVDTTNERVGIGTASPDTQLEVVGTISGSVLRATDSLYGAGLSDCDTADTSKLLWDATTGQFSCGTDTNTDTHFSGTGSLQTFFDDRFVNKSGDTMTGALVINAGDSQPALILSGASVSSRLQDDKYSEWTRSASGNVLSLKNQVEYQSAETYAAYFDGNDYITASSSAMTQIFTIAAWIKTSGSSFPSIIACAGGGCPQVRLSGGKLALLKAQTANIGASNTSVNTNTWTHVAVTYDVSGNYQFYVNGAADGNGTNLQTFTLSNTVTIGSNGTPGSESFTGSIDDLRVYSSALSSGDIAAIYNGGAGTLANSPSGINAWWNFDEGAGSTAADSSGNGYDGTLGGSTTWVTGKVPAGAVTETTTLFEARDGGSSQTKDRITLGNDNTDTRLNGDRLSFFGGGTEHMRLTSGGLLGIGTTTPTEELEVVGTISGSVLRATDSLYGAGLTDCDTADTSKLLWDATTGQFSCGTDTDTDTNTNQLTTFTLSGDSGSDQTISHGNTFEIAGGDEITTTASATDTLTINITDDTVDFTELEDTLDLDASTTLNFGGSDFIYNLTSTGDFMIRNSGSPLFFINSSGKVGIGTETPTNELEVIGTISGSTIHAQDLLTSSGQLIVEANDTYEPASIFLDQNANGTGMLIDSESSSQAAFALDISATGRDASGDATNTHLLFGYNNVFDTNLFRQKADTLYTDDSLWVGETASGARVHAQDRLTSSGTLTVDDTTRFKSKSDASTFFQINDADGGNPVFNVDTTNERVGIGTASPLTNLQLNSAASPNLLLTRTDTTILDGNPLGSLRWGGLTDADAGDDSLVAKIEAIANGDWTSGSISSDIVFSTQLNATLSEAMRINKNGNVGIGTQSPLARLDVVSAEYQTGAYIYSSGASVLALDNYSGTTGSGMNAHISFGYKNVFDTELYRHGGTGSGGIVIKTQQTSTTDNAFRVVTQNGSENNTVFKVRADGAVTAEGSFTGGGADLAEWFPTADPGMKPGDITCLDPARPKHVKRCNSYDLKMIGIVSTKPGFVGNSQIGIEGNSALIGLIGQVPVKVIGNVDIGDSITLSKTDSVGKRAGEYDPSICIAMEEHRGGEIGLVTCLLTRNTGSSGGAPVNSKTVADYLLKSFKDTMRLDDF